MTFSKNYTWLTFNKDMGVKSFPFTLFYQFTLLNLGLGTTDFIYLYWQWLNQATEQPNGQITDYQVTIKGSCLLKNISFL